MFYAKQLTSQSYLPISLNQRCIHAFWHDALFVDLEICQVEKLQGSCLLLGLKEYSIYLL